MSRYTKPIAIVCGMAAMAACSVNQPLPGSTVVPAMQIRHSHESAQGYYALGRYYHGASRLDDALKAYQKALELEPTHLHARNAMAVIHANRGEYQLAVLLLRDIAGTGAEASYTYSNLGYIYFLQGDYKSAEVALETATTLDAANVRAWNNLGTLMERTGREAYARTIYAHAKALERSTPGSKKSVTRSPEVKVVKDAPRGAAKLTGAAPSLGSLRPSMDGADRTAIYEVGPGIYEARGRTIDSVAVAVMTPEKSAGATARLEISNGNGVTGMAKSLAGLINNTGVQVVRLTNQPQFRIVSTRIEYRAGYEAAARSLANGLGQDVALKPSGMGNSVDLRLVLGRDMMNAKAVRSDRMRPNGSVVDTALARR